MNRVETLDWMVQQGIIGHSKMSGYYEVGTKRNIPANEMGKVEAEGRSRYNAVEAITSFMKDNVYLPWGKVFINQQPYECYYDIEANNGKNFNFKMEDGNEGRFGGVTYKFEVKQREGNYTLEYFKNNPILLNYHKVQNVNGLVICYITSDGYAMFFDAENYDKLEPWKTTKTQYDWDGESMDTSVRAFYTLDSVFYITKLNSYGN